MNRHISLIALAAAILLTGCSAGTAEERASRRYNAEGNEHYSAKRYADAEASYTKAVDADPTNFEAKYNLAMSMIRQAGAGESGKKLMDDAKKLLTEVWQDPSASPELASHAAYNTGNIAYNVEQWDPAIAAYKQALRFNPDDDLARENLRMAQLKKGDQQQDQDQNKYQDKDQDKQDKQDKQDQKKDQDKQDQKPTPPQQNDPDNKEQPQNPKPQSGISDENAEKILKAMENEETATRRRVQEAERRKAASAGRRTVTNPW